MDNTLLVFFNQTLAHPILDVLMVGFTYSLWLLPGLGVVLILARQRRVGAAILASLTVGLALTLILQFLALRPRPEHVRLVMAMPIFPSYPSGHAVAAFGVAAVLMLSYRRRDWQGLALLAACLISLSRVCLGHHYPSDILGGAVLGAAVGAACYGLIAAPHTDQAPWRWLLWPQVAVVCVVTQMAYLYILPTHLLRWPMADKALHFALFGSIAFWLNLWLGGRALYLNRWAIPLAIVIPFAFALAEESLQALSPVRAAGFDDLACDLAGMLVFWWASRQLAPPPTRSLLQA